MPLIYTTALVLLALAGLLLAAFIGYYHFRITWWKSGVGQILMARSVAFLILIAATIYIAGTPTHGTTAEGIILLAASTILFTTMGVHLVGMMLEQRRGRDLQLRKTLEENDGEDPARAG